MQVIQSQQCSTDARGCTGNNKAIDKADHWSHEAWNLHHDDFFVRELEKMDFGLEPGAGEAELSEETFRIWILCLANQQRH